MTNISIPGMTENRRVWLSASGLSMTVTLRSNILGHDGLVNLNNFQGHCCGENFKTCIRHGTY